MRIKPKLRGGIINPKDLLASAREVGGEIKGKAMLRAMVGGSPATGKTRDGSKAFIAKSYQKALKQEKKRIGARPSGKVIKRRVPKSKDTVTEKDQLARYAKSLELRRARTLAAKKVGRNAGASPGANYGYNKNSLKEIAYNKNRVRKKLERRGYSFSIAESIITQLDELRGQI